MDCNVGELRNQASYAGSDAPVIVVDEEGRLQFELVRFYPDTTNPIKGDWSSCFKVVVRVKP